jgi:hypothetical protein
MTAYMELVGILLRFVLKVPVRENDVSLSNLCKLYFAS